MRNIFFFLSFLMAIRFFSPAFAQDDILAEVNGDLIYKSELQKILNELGDEAKMLDMSDVKRFYTNKLIENKLLFQVSNTDTLRQDPEVVDRIMDAEERVLQEVYLEREVKKRISERMLKNRYKEILAKMPREDEYEARHILVKDAETAMEILQRLKKGDDFAALAKEYSKDSTAEKGGYLGWIKKGQTVAPFEAAMMALEPKKYSALPVQTRFGWHIIKLEDTRKAEPPSYEALRGQIEARVTRDLIQQVVAELKGRANIKYHDESVMPAAPAPGE